MNLETRSMIEFNPSIDCKFRAPRTPTLTRAAEGDAARSQGRVILLD